MGGSYCASYAYSCGVGKCIDGEPHCRHMIRGCGGGGGCAYVPPPSKLALTIIVFKQTLSTVALVPIEFIQLLESRTLLACIF